MHATKKLVLKSIYFNKEWGNILLFFFVVRSVWIRLTSGIRGTTDRRYLFFKAQWERTRTQPLRDFKINPMIVVSARSKKVTVSSVKVFDTFCVCLSVGGGLGCGWGLDAPAHPSATILWPRVTCFYCKRFRVTVLHSNSSLQHSSQSLMIIDNYQKTLRHIINHPLELNRAIWAPYETICMPH